MQAHEGVPHRLQTVVTQAGLAACTSRSASPTAACLGRRVRVGWKAVRMTVAEEMAQLLKAASPGLLALAGVWFGARLTLRDAREARQYERRADLYVDLLAEAARWREHMVGSEVPVVADSAFRVLKPSPAPSCGCSGRNFASPPCLRCTSSK